MKKLVSLLCVLTVLFFLQTSASAAENEQNEKEGIVPSSATYTLAVIPTIDKSGMEEKERKVALRAIEDSMKKKYPKKTTKVVLLDEKTVAQAVRRNPFENYDAPVLSELVAVGKDLRADRLIYLSIEPIKREEDGFMVVVGTQTYASEISMKMKCVDLEKEDYIFNQLVVKEGSSSAVSFWKFGGASKSRAVKKAISACMEEFLNSFD